MSRYRGSKEQVLSIVFADPKQTLSPPEMLPTEETSSPCKLPVHLPFVEKMFMKKRSYSPKSSLPYLEKSQPITPILYKEASPFLPQLFSSLTPPPFVPIKRKDLARKALSPQQEEGERVFSPPPLTFQREEEPFRQSAPISSIQEHLIKKDLQLSSSTIRFPSNSSLDVLSCRNEERALSWSDAFLTQVDYFEKGPNKILFAITLLPKPGADFEKLPQHIYYLMDTANVIQQSRLKATKNAIIRSLSYLSHEDRFNIIGFDHKLRRFAQENLSPTSYNKKLTRQFLQGLDLGSMFFSANPYKALSSLLHEQIDPEAISTIVLLTNGDGLGNKHHYRKQMREFSQRNAGKFNLFCLGMTEDEQLPMLETLALFNKGSLYASPTKGGLKRKLGKLIQSIQSPIATNLSVHACSKDPELSICLTPKNARLGDLYANTPLIILGETDSLSNFTLFIQGKRRGEFVQIRKKISFDQATKVEDTLEQSWALEKAVDYYHEFFFTGDKEHAKKALAYLNAHELPPIFP